MATAERLYTVEEYLALDRDAEIKSEYRAGEIVAMAGASPEHAEIALNIGATLLAQLRKRPCRTYGSDLRVKLEVSSRYVYPDVTVVCGEPRFEATQPRTLLNPTMIVEVLSSSTEAYDRGEKFAHYRRIPTLTDYVLVAQDRPYVEHFERHGEETWLYRAFEGRDAALALPALACTLALRDVYDKVEFPTEAPA